MPTDPLPSLAELLAEADRVDADALALRRAFPRAVVRVLHLAARSGSIGRRAASLNAELARAGVARRVVLAPTEPPVSAVGPLWAALLAGDPPGEEGGLSGAAALPRATAGRTPGRKTRGPSRVPTP